MSYIPDGYGQATLNFDFISGPSNPMAIVHGYSHAGVNPAGHAGVIMGLWRDQWMPGPDVTNNLLFKGVDCVEDTEHALGSATTNTVGPSSDVALPPQVAILVQKQTGLGGRKNRGRMYIPGCTNASLIEGGFLLGAAQIRLQENIDDYLLGLETNDLNMVVLHSTLGLGTPATVVTLTVDSVCATQRRRVR